jgi:hypothetical protein
MIKKKNGKLNPVGVAKVIYAEAKKPNTKSGFSFIRSDKQEIIVIATSVTS